MNATLKNFLLTRMAEPNSAKGKYAARWLEAYGDNNPGTIKEVILEELEAFGIIVKPETLAIMTEKDLIGLWWDTLREHN